jgi:hypothetical protein
LWAPPSIDSGLHSAVLLGLALIGHDERLREAIRRELEAAGRQPREGRSPAEATSGKALGALLEERRKLLRLHYAGRVDEEQFGEEQERLTAQFEVLRAQDQAEAQEQERAADVAERFEAIASYLADLDVDTIWREATEVERRVLVDELLEGVQVHEDHLEVVVRGAPRLNVAFDEVGLTKKGGNRSARTP